MAFVKTTLPSNMRAVILGGSVTCRSEVLVNILQLKPPGGSCYLCSEYHHLYPTFASDCKFEKVDDLPSLKPHSLVVFDSIPQSKLFKSYLLSRDDISYIYLCDTYTEVPFKIRDALNYAVLFQQDAKNIAMFYCDQIFGISDNVFEDMCEFVWGDSVSDYLVIDMSPWNYVYMKNFKFSININA